MPSAKNAKPTSPKATAAPKSAESDTLAKKLARLSIERELDLTLHLPLRYEDHTKATPIAALVAGMPAVTEGEITASEIQYKPRRQWICVVESAGQPLMLRFFTFYPNQLKTLSVGKRVRVIGEPREGYYGLEMVHPQVTLLNDTSQKLPEKLTPVYPTTNGLSQQTLSRTIQKALAKEALTGDILPEVYRLGEHLWSWRDALLFLHTPPTLSEVEYGQLQEGTHPAMVRVKFDELLTQQLSLKSHRRNRARQIAFAMKGNHSLVTPFLASLPFTLTAAQKRVWTEISEDLSRATPMNRLLEGDVGSGKTVIAALAALRALEEKKQAVLMAPTEILAEQHYRKLSQWLAKFPVRIVWLTGSLPNAERRAALEALASGEPALAIGTHALFQEHVTMPNLGLAIVDEQHRFGVAQRLALRMKGAAEPSDCKAERPRGTHQLMMSATPIPRTLAMSFYADLDVSVIDERPAGRGNIVTRLVNQSRRDEIIAYIGAQCEKGAQAYWVCPLIEESEHLSLVAAQTLFAELSGAFDGETEINGAILPKLTVGLLHGKLKPAEKTAMMEAFVRGEISVLVATTVIEVGVDVANARLMVIEHAERFGLAQLHQLRGRVGRGTDESRCVLLFETPLSDAAKARLKAIYETNDGFLLAREDLKQRGPGEFLGARQSGVPMLRYADPERDEVLLLRAAHVADRILATPESETLTATFVSRWLEKSASFYDV